MIVLTPCLGLVRPGLIVPCAAMGEAQVCVEAGERGIHCLSGSRFQQWRRLINSQGIGGWGLSAEVQTHCQVTSGKNVMKRICATSHISIVGDS